MSQIKNNNIERPISALFHGVVAVVGGATTLLLDSKNY